MPQQKVVVRLVTACKLPARSGKLLQARVCQTQPSFLSRLFEPNGHLYSNQTVYNFAEALTWLRRGQILSWMQNTEVADTDQDLHPLNSTPESAFQSS